MEEVEKEIANFLKRAADRIKNLREGVAKSLICWKCGGLPTYHEKTEEGWQCGICGEINQE